jgi:hypothetical protein
MAAEKKNFTMASDVIIARGEAFSISKVAQI